MESRADHLGDRGRSGTLKAMGWAISSAPAPFRGVDGGEPRRLLMLVSRQPRTVIPFGAQRSQRRSARAVIDHFDLEQCQPEIRHPS
jgi:hypothetical protein